MKSKEGGLEEEARSSASQKLRPDLQPIPDPARAFRSTPVRSSEEITEDSLEGRARAEMDLDLVR